MLFQETVNFFQKTLNKDLSAEGQLEFLNMWYIMIIVNDVLIILGSAIKEQIERQVSCNSHMLYVQKLKVEVNFGVFLCAVKAYEGVDQVRVIGQLQLHQSWLEL